MKKNLIITICLFVLFVILTVLVKCVDVDYTLTGKLGLYNLNTNLLPEEANQTMDTISDICLYLSFVAFFAVVALGIYELLTLKSFKKVDLSIYVYAITSILVVVCYIIFDKVVINYRPIFVDGALESSYPSSHILLTTFFILGAVFVYKAKIKNKNINIILLCVSIILVILTFLGRILSLNHWFTDCLAGLILALAFVMLLITLTQILTLKFNNNSKTIEA